MQAERAFPLISYDESRGLNDGQEGKGMDILIFFFVWSGLEALLEQLSCGQYSVMIMCGSGWVWLV